MLALIRWLASIIEEKPGFASSRRVILFALTALVMYITTVFAKITIETFRALLIGTANPNVGALQAILVVGWPLIIGSIVGLLTTLQWMKYIDKVGEKAQAPGATTLPK